MKEIDLTAIPISVYGASQNCNEFIELVEKRKHVDENGKFYVRYKGKFYPVQSDKYETYIIIGIRQSKTSWFKYKDREYHKKYQKEYYHKKKRKIK